jgi:DNA modification methylase
VFGTEQEDVRGRVHPTQKPIGVSSWVLEKYSKDGWLVVDLFGGSGSTLIAAEQLDRVCYMMELDPKYVDVIRKRYAKFIGREEEWEKATPREN